VKEVKHPLGEEEYLAWRYLARAYLDLYWRNGLSLEEIARRFGVSKETIRSRMKKLNIPRRKGGELGVPINPDTCYVLGALVGDGYVQRNKANRNYEINLQTTDRIFAIRVKQKLDKLRIPSWLFCPKRRTKAGNTVYWLYFVRKRIYDLVKQIRLNPDILKVLLKTADEVREFIHGFYDAEGCFDRDGYRIELDNTNRRLMEIVYDFLVKLGYKPKFYNYEYHKIPKYRIHIPTTEQSQRFMKEVVGGEIPHARRV
jgi:intein/homing endonuclease